jgi:Cof subfamily protein (haloacid dehalogenase superfamily)
VTKKTRPKLIAVDLDGTLLNSDSEMSDRTCGSLKRAMEAGAHVSVSTGRMYPSAMPFVRALGTSSPCIFYNGAVIRNPKSGEFLYKKGIGEELTSEIVNMYCDRNWYIQIYSDDKLYVKDDTDPRCKHYEGISGMKAVPLGDNFRSFRADSMKLLGIASGTEELERMFTESRNAYKDRIYTATSWHIFVEMVHIEVNKARALERVAKMLGIDRECVMAIGDGGNDREMIKWAGMGVAMENASSATKAEADIIAPSNDADGVAAIIDDYFG